MCRFKSDPNRKRLARRSVEMIYTVKELLGDVVYHAPKTNYYYLAPGGMENGCDLCTGAGLKSSVVSPQFETCNSCEAIIAERMDRRSGSGGAPALSRSVASFQDFSWEDAVGEMRRRG